MQCNKCQAENDVSVAMTIGRSRCDVICIINKQQQMSVHHIDRLVQERRNSIANALELRLSCTEP